MQGDILIFGNFGSLEIGGFSEQSVKSEKFMKRKKDCENNLHPKHPIGIATNNAINAAYCLSHAPAILETRSIHKIKRGILHNEIAALHNRNVTSKNRVDSK